MPKKKKCTDFYLKILLKNASHSSLTTGLQNKYRWKGSKYCENHQNVAQKHKVEQMLLGKWCPYKCSMQTYHNL